MGSVTVNQVSDTPSGNDQLVGRGHEHRTLTSAFKDAQFGRGRLILVGGEAGIGKTTLVEHFVAGVSGATVLTGTCYDATSAPPYAPWQEAFSSVRVEDYAEPAVPHWLDEEQLSSLKD
jgi:hypothetical protein